MGLWIGLIAVVLSFIIAPTGGFAILFYCFPHILVRLGLRYQAYRSGMTIKYVGDENNVFCYGEKNRPRKDKISIVFIHGFTSSKDQWFSCFKKLPSDIHMIALDLPGHGGSSRPETDLDISFNNVIDLVDKFFQLVGLDGVRIHLVGSSLGGAIAGLYAAKYPQKIDRVSLACPAVETPVDTDLQLQVKKLSSMNPEQISYGDCILLTHTLQDLKNMFYNVCVNKKLIALPDQIYQGILNLRLSRLPFFLMMVKSLASVNQLDTLSKEAHKITVPCQLIWGSEDEFIHVSGAELLKSVLPDCRHVDIIEECGHAIHIDRPGAFNKHIIKFYYEGEDRKEV